jgi:hypothetical protein
MAFAKCPVTGHLPDQWAAWQRIQGHATADDDGDGEAEAGQPASVGPVRDHVRQALAARGDRGDGVIIADILADAFPVPRQSQEADTSGPPIPLR